MKEPADRIRVVASGLLMVCLSIAAMGASAEPQGEPNGFSLEEAIVDVREIIAAGPGRDSIPALVHPKALSTADSPWADDVRVIGVEVGGEARAYPLAVLNWHELVNDTLGGLAKRTPEFDDPFPVDRPCEELRTRSVRELCARGRADVSRADRRTVPARS